MKLFGSSQIGYLKVGIQALSANQTELLHLRIRVELLHPGDSALRDPQQVVAVGLHYIRDDQHHAVPDLQPQ